MGSNVLVRRDGTLDVTRMSALVDQIAELNKPGVETTLISSGAAALGRSEMHPQEKLDSADQRQLFSTVGQVKLINHYYGLSHEHGITVGRVPTTKENFSIRRHYLNQKNRVTAVLENGVIPIVNENDTISVSEPMFTDSDELSRLVVSMMDAQALIILSNIDGIYNGSPSDPASAITCEIEHGKDLSNYIQATKSSFGRGGMLTRMNVARKVTGEGITVIIANRKWDSVLIDLLQQPDDTVCTRFIPSTETVSSVKRWIAHNKGFIKEEIHISECATDVLSSKKATNILPIGITHIEGKFEKDDIVCIMDSQGNRVSVGKANYDSAQTREAVDKRGKKPVIHYDYLCIEQRT